MYASISSPTCLLSSRKSPPKEEAICYWHFVTPNKSCEHTDGTVNMSYGLLATKRAVEQYIGNFFLPWSIVDVRFCNKTSEKFFPF